MTGNFHKRPSLSWNAGDVMEGRGHHGRIGRASVGQRRCCLLRTSNDRDGAADGCQPGRPGPSRISQGCPCKLFRCVKVAGSKTCGDFGGCGGQGCRVSLGCRVGREVQERAFFSLMPTSDIFDVVLEVRWSFLCPVRHCPHLGPGPLLQPVCPHSYTAQLPPLDPPEATTSVAVSYTHLTLPTIYSV